MRKQRILEEGDRRKVVYVCSPLRGDTQKNIARARWFCRFVFTQNGLPVAPHTMFTEFLDDEIPSERAEGMKLALHLLAYCDELWVFGDQITEGMAGEIEIARALGMPIVYHIVEESEVSKCQTES